MPTRSDEQEPRQRFATIPQDSARDATPLSVPTPLPMSNEPEVVYELRDDEFILVDPDETIEFQTGAHMPRPGASPPTLPTLPTLPPLPPWAAASRAMLDGAPAQAASELREAREDLIRFTRQAYAREVYVQEVERALAAAHGRVRGQAFRIAELEQTLRATEAETLRTGRELELRAADAESLRAMLELDLRAAHAARQPSPLITRALVPPPSAADDTAPGTALLSLREYAVQLQPTVTGGMRYSVGAQSSARAAPKRRAARKSATKRDDLQRIKGIGPSMAERLAKAGVKSFESVAGWKAQDLERMSEKLGVSRARIERQAWVKQARALARKR